MKRNTYTALAVLVLGCFYFSRIEPYVARHWAYPMAYKEAVYTNAVKNHIDPSLINAVILAESKYKETAQSDKGALGLMQLMPDTAHWIREEMDLPAITDAQITNPTTNIQLGSWYLAYLLKEFKGNDVLALAAYNAGRGHVESWMETYGWDYQFVDIDAIPFPETRQYVRTVLSYKERYESLYGTDYSSLPGN